MQGHLLRHWGKVGATAIDGAKDANLNLKVSKDEGRAFKEICVEHRTSQIDEFRLAMKLSAKHLDEENKDGDGNMSRKTEDK